MGNKDKQYEFIYLPVSIVIWGKEFRKLLFRNNKRFFFKKKKIDMLINDKSTQVLYLLPLECLDKKKKQEWRFYPLSKDKR